MDEVEVEVVEAEPLQARVEGAQRGVATLVVVPDLGRHEQVVAVDAGLGDGLADGGLVVVELGGVDVSVADLESGRDGCLGLGRGDLEDAEPDLRDLDAVVEGQGGYLGGQMGEDG